MTDPSIPEILAAAAGIALTSRSIIERTDLTSYRDVCETLDAVHEHLAVAGGSLLLLAERLDCKAEVERLIKEGQDRLNTYRAFAGQRGRA